MSEPGLCGTHLDQYAIERYLGDGGFGAVYAGRHLQLHRPVAIKILHSEWGSEMGRVQRAMRDAQAASSVGNPHIGSLADWGMAGDSPPFLVTELLEGRDLATVLSDEGPLSPERAVGITLKILQGVGAAHEAGLMHLDLKPGNVFMSLERDEVPGRELLVVLDYGMYRLFEGLDVAALAASRAIARTLPYMACEGLRGGAGADCRTDLYAVACLLYEMLAGRRVFPADTPEDVVVSITAEDPELVTVHANEVPRGLAEVIDVALCRNPDGRFPDAGSFAYALLSAMHETDPRVPGVTFSRTGHPVRRWAARTTELRRPDTNELLRHVVAAEVRAAQPRERTSVFPRHGSLFVGRHEEMEAVLLALSGAARVVSLVGLPGSGRTRLASMAAQKLLATGKTAGGARQIRVESEDTLLDVVCRVAHGLDVSVASGEEAAQVRQVGLALRARQPFLLIVSGPGARGAGVLEAATALGEIAPKTRFLVCAGAALGLAGEESIDVLGLPCPPDGATPAGELGQYEAAQLFIDRARSVRAGYRVGPRDALSLAALLRRLSGLPLAIELVAARMATFDAATILEALDRAGLGAEGAKAPRVLETVVAWSHSLLTPDEKRLLAEGLVFRGGFTLEAASSVVRLSAGGGTAGVADALTSLEARGFVVMEEKEGTRFRLRDGVARYVAALPETEEVRADARARHAAYYVDVAEIWAEQIPGREGREALRLLLLERANVEAAYRFALTHGRPSAPGDADLPFRAVLALEPVYRLRGPLHVRLANLDRALAHATRGSEPLTAKALLARAHARSLLGADRVGEAGEDAREALGLARSLSDVALEARAERRLAASELREGAFDAALRSLSSALDRSRAAGDRREEGRALASLGVVVQRLGDVNEAAGYFEEAFQCHRQADDMAYLANTASHLGLIALARGDTTRARERTLLSAGLLDGLSATHHGRALLDRAAVEQGAGRAVEAQDLIDRALTAFALGGHEMEQGMGLAHRADLRHALGDAAGARDDYRDALAIFQECGREREAAVSAAALAAVWATLGQGPVARDLLSFAEHETARLGDPLTVQSTSLFAAVVAACDRGGEAGRKRLEGVSQEAATWLALYHEGRAALRMLRTVVATRS